MKKILFALCILLCSVTSFATVDLSIGKTDLQLNDTFRVILTFDHELSNDAPDLVPLLKDFDILSTERSVSYSNINGKVSSSGQWSLVLRPKRVGTLTIPPITIGRESSLPTKVVVTDNSQVVVDEKKSNSSYTILQASVNESNPYINQEVIYTVKLLNRQRLYDAQYTPPEVENALVIPLGDGHHSQTKYKGETFEVEEQSYAIFPQKKGEFIISPPTFTADLYDGFSPTRLRIEAEKVVLNIKPLPEGVNVNNWLAAKNITLEESYSQSDKPIEEGDTIVRTINLQAYGLVAQLLPTLNFVNSNQYNVYVDKPTIQNEFRYEDLFASATYKITYLLSKSGTISLPAIKVPWYNIVTKKNEVALLPAKEILVKLKPSTKIKKIKPKQDLANVHAIKKTTVQGSNRIIYFLLVSFLILIGFYLFRRKFSGLQKEKINNSSQKSLQKACKINDPIRARIALIDFARKQWPDVTILNLNDIPIQNEDFKEQLRLLSLALYAEKADTNWNGDVLWRIFSKLKFKKTLRKSSKKDLPSIYLQ
ncbi:MAG: BatD family protein [Legionellaceae bacterium]|nr:BatD family protein [Legionellaceae bacterium]